MIDTMGYGIHLMHARQAKRYFPMPDYSFPEEHAVCATIYGEVVDPAYSRLLIQKTDLPLSDILALDRVQKKLPIPDEKARQLRQDGLIEGRKPNYHVSAKVAAATSKKADYIRTRAFDNEYYNKMITEYLSTYGKASRKDLDELLIDKLSDALTLKQKKDKIGNLLSNLRAKGAIYNDGSRTAPQWKLVEQS